MLTASAMLLQHCADPVMGDNWRVCSARQKKQAEAFLDEICSVKVTTLKVSGKSQIKPDVQCRLHTIWQFC